MTAHSEVMTMKALRLDAVATSEATPVEIALASDSAMLEPALVALFSVWRNTSRAIILHFLGQGLSRAEQRRLETLCGHLGVLLRYHPLSPAAFRKAEQKDPDISLVTLARTLLPELVPGRVLYLDCDVLVLGDVAELFDTDLGHASIAAVRDLRVVELWRDTYHRSDKLRGHVAVMGDYPVTDYFNAGLLLMDCAAIRATPGLVEEMQDFETASRFPLLDQDHLNRLFRGHSRLLGADWNEIWGRSRHRRRVLREAHLGEGDSRAPRMLHYTGPHKPWKRLRLSTVTRGKLWAFLMYRRAVRDLRRSEQTWAAGSSARS
ncbi:MAG: glycosyltransferase family 8 protein [Rhodobacteraceae bacterium]|nr:glycosyltransferase family 8 protein [Paracoccaceae bacterium]MBR9822851.1 glycosyltransferase family 8 protein [Paracoccaceae bacterium]